MKKQFSAIGVIILFAALIISCSSKKETASSVAQKWCELNARVHKAEDEAAKEAAKLSRKNFENEIDNKYKGDEAFRKELEKEVEKCEAASEGRD